MIGSTLAFYIFKLREEGYEIKTKIKKAPMSGSKYAEYTLSPDWRLIGEEMKRGEIEVSNVLTPRSFRIGDFAVTKNGEVGEVISIDRAFIGLDLGGREVLFFIDEMKRKLSKKEILNVK